MKNKEGPVGAEEIKKTDLIKRGMKFDDETEYASEGEILEKLRQAQGLQDDIDLIKESERLTAKKIKDDELKKRAS